MLEEGSGGDASCEDICLWNGWVCLEDQLEVEMGLTSLKLCQMVHLFQLRTGGDSFTYWHVLMSSGLVFWQENWHTRGIVVKIVKTSVCVCVCAKKNVTHRLLITHLFESESLAWTTRQSQHNSVFLACSLKKKRNRKSDFNDLTVIITCHAWLR